MYFRGKKKSKKEISLYEPIGADKEGNPITLDEIVEHPASELWDQVILKKEVSQLYSLLPKVLSRREQYIVCKRYGLYNMHPTTQQEIASTLGISRSYVSRIEKKALEKLRHAFMRE